MSISEPDHNALTELQAGLPASFYTDEAHYRRELEAIFYRHWNYLCRAEEIAAPRSYQVVKLGDQQIVVLRDDDGKLQAFHNTCRHRGSLLLEAGSGVLRSDALVCPYHAWSYSLQGDLRRIPSKQRPAGFDPACFSLYPVRLELWCGMVFINLDTDTATSIEDSFDLPRGLASWPLESLRVGHTLRKSIHCNWKLFWENYSECLHCPGVHPELSKLVPVYGQFLMEVQDDPNWRSRLEQEPLFKPGLAAGMQTWSADGQFIAPLLPGLSQEEIASGHTFITSWPSVYVVGHADYVRIVRLRPLSATETELQAQWLFAPETLANPDFDAAAVAAFTEMVMMQDAAITEINQRGLGALPHQAGVLLPEEYEVFAFQQWVRKQLSE